MKVLLVVSTNQYKYIYPSPLSINDFPTGFAYLASSLHKAGHEIFGLNLNNDASYSSAQEMVSYKLKYTLQEVQPDLVGLGGLCTDYKFIKDTMQIIRNVTPNTLIVLGGGIVTNDREYIHNLLKPDFSIAGEAEEAIVKLAESIEKNDYNIYRDCPSPNTIDINQRPFPDYEPFDIKDMIDNYSMSARWLYRYTRPHPRPMVIVTARGCPFSCTFCIHGRRETKYRARSIDNVMQEIELMYNKYEFNVLIILDELFAVNKARMKEFCITLIEKKYKHRWDFDWIFQTHPSASLDYETLKLAKEAGCYLFAYGLESASPTVLRSMNKKTKVPQVVETIKIAEQAEIGFGGNFIFGDIAETQETITETMDFFEQYGKDIHISLSTIQPYPGSQLFEDCIDRGIIKDKFKYYEKIDEGSKNMTSIPDRVWFPWVYCLSLLSGSLLWTKITDAVRCKIKNGLIELVAECPYCHRKVHYIESIGTNVIDQPLKRTKKMLWILMKTAFFYLLNPKHSLLKTLKPILENRDISPSIATSCPYCNKRFRIRIPNGKSSFIKKILLEAVWILIK